MKIRANVYLDPHDMWLGVHWTRMKMAWLLPPALEKYGEPKFKMVTTIYICPFFCFVIRITIEGREET
jgi:hypothetical protein